MTAPLSNKRAAAAAAKNLLAARISLVEELGEALDAHSKAVDALEHAQQNVDETAEAARTAFDAAKGGGWTAAELNSTGLKPPAAPGPGHRPQSTTRAAQHAGLGHRSTDSNVRHCGMRPTVAAATPLQSRTRCPVSAATLTQWQAVVDEHSRRAGRW